MRRTKLLFAKRRRRAILVALPLALAACGGVDGGSASDGDQGGDGGSGASAGSGADPSAAGGAPAGSSSSGTSDVSAGPGGSGAQGGDPPFGGSSNGSGGEVPVPGSTRDIGGVTYRLIVESSYGGSPTPLLIVYSGVEGGQTMTSNLLQLGSFTGTDGFIRAVLDGATYNGNGQAGATVLDDIRAKYNIDNDRTYLLSESAGTSAALELGFHLRQSYFAAYWANDVNAVDAPAQASAALGFEPWGQVGPGGQFAIADQIVGAMQAAEYRLPNPAPYAGPGAGQHGSAEQFIEAMSWFAGKTRQ